MMAYPINHHLFITKPFFSRCQTAAYEPPALPEYSRLLVANGFYRFMVLLGQEPAAADGKGEGGL